LFYRLAAWLIARPQNQQAGQHEHAPEEGDGEHTEARSSRRGASEQRFAGAPSRNSDGLTHRASPVEFFAEPFADVDAVIDAQTDCDACDDAHHHAQGVAEDGHRRDDPAHTEHHGQDGDKAQRRTAMCDPVGDREDRTHREQCERETHKHRLD